MKKVIVHKKDGIPAVIQKILDCREVEIVLSIPQDSALEKHGGEFYLILRESKAADKQVSIETESERIIEYALSAGIKVKNLPADQDKKTLTDIIPQRTLKIPTKSSTKDKEKERKPGFFSAKDKQIKKSPSRPLKSFFSFQRKTRDFSVSEDDRKRDEEKEALFRRFKRPLFFLLGLFLIFAAVSCFIFLPKLEAHLVFKKINWIFSDETIAGVQAKDLAYEKVVLPVQLFRLDKNLIFEADATGEKHVENKAVGKIIIYNAYSSQPQPLVQNTRFVTPEGKIFRLTKNIIIPGAKIKEGKIIPSSIEAEVMADQPGKEYNLGPVSRLLIPGFHGGAKYDGFYGELKEPTKGGFIGKVKVPTESDVFSAKEEARSKVKDVLLFEVLSRLPEGFKILDGAALFTVLREEVDSVADAEGKFRVLVYAEKRVLSFREEDLINGLRHYFFKRAGSQDFVLRNYTLSYQLVSADFENNLLALRVEFNSEWIQSFDEKELKEKLAGQKEPEIRAAVLSLDGIDRAKVELSPFWVRTAPLNPERIEITFE